MSSKRPQIDWCTVKVTSRNHAVEGASFEQEAKVIAPVAKKLEARKIVKILNTFKADAPLTREEKLKFSSMPEVTPASAEKQTFAPTATKEKVEEVKGEDTSK